MKVKKFNPQKVFLSRSTTERDKIDAVSYPGWVSFSNLPNVFGKSVKLDDYPDLLGSLRSNDTRSLTNSGLEGCLYMFTDSFLIKQRKHNNLTLKSSIGTSFSNGRNVMIVDKNDCSVFFVNDHVLYANDLEADEELAASLSCFGSVNRDGVLKIVIPFFEDDKADFEAALYRVLGLINGDNKLSSTDVVVLIVNLGTPFVVDNQPYK